MDGLQKRKRNWWIQRSSSAGLSVQVCYTATRGRPSITEEEKRYVDVSNCRRLPNKDYLCTGRYVQAQHAWRNQVLLTVILVYTSNGNLIWRQVENDKGYKCKKRYWQCIANIPTSSIIWHWRLLHSRPSIKKNKIHAEKTQASMNKKVKKKVKW